MANDGASTTAATNFVEVAAGIVCAFVTNNAVTRADLPNLINSVHGALRNAAEPRPPEPARPIPPVPIKKTIGHDAIISLEDGRAYQSLKRHLTGRGLTPAQYRQKWGLPSDYPMVAPSYSERRSQIAIRLGLGQQRRKSAAKTAAASSKTVRATAPKKKGTSRKRTR